MRQRRPLANISHVWLLIPWIGVVLAAKRPIRDNSFLWHVRAGHLQTSAGEVLTSDPFSLVYAGQPWRTQSWLLELIYARLGDDLVWVGTFVGLMGGLALLAIGVCIYDSTRSVRWTGALIVWLELIALPYFAPRPVVVSFVFIGLLMVALRSSRLRWTIPLLLWVWASMHGSFVLGGGLIVLDGLARRDKGRIGDVLAAGFAVSVTAHGWHAWETVIRFLQSSDSLAYISEWGSPDVLSRQVLPFTALLVGILFVATKGGLSTRHLWIVAPFVVFGISTSRAVMPASLVLMVFLAVGIGRREQNRLDPESIPATVLVGLLAIAPFAIPFAQASSLDPSRFPVDVAGSLADLPTFHDDVVGGYLIFRGENPGRVMLDDRAELYPADYIRSSIATRNGTPEWLSFFNEHGIVQALIRPSDGLSSVLEERADWNQVESDAEFEVWRRVGY